ncbi:MAG TPA: hypothetical protein VHJ82_09235 [Actinomycetota bacterium]|nr:hypothetical protein [Actinomycetota bacterium]
MSEGKRRLVERILDPAFVDALEGKEMRELRLMREECREAETEISFERRLCQGRIDILSAELDRRYGRQDDDLVARLPQILAGDELHADDKPLPDRAPDFSIPRNADIPRRRVEEIVGEQTLARMATIPSDEIKAIIESLASHERELSERRHSVHQVMDRIQSEIVRRYTSGEADPASALA